MAETKDRLSDVLESIPTAFYSLDHEWRFSYINSAAEALIGYRREDAVGQVVWELFPAAVGTIIEETYRAGVATGQPAFFEAYYPEPLNAWYEIRAHPVPDGLLVYFVDITTKRAAQEADDRATVRSRLTAQVASVLARTLDPEAAAASIPQILVPQLADWCIISLVNDGRHGSWRDRIRDVGSWHMQSSGRQLIEQLRPLRMNTTDESSPLFQALRIGRPVLDRGPAAAELVSPAPGTARELAGQLASDNVAVYPLLGRGQTVGVLTLVNGDERGRFTGDDLGTLQEVTNQIGLALDNARLYAQQRDLAEELQYGLLAGLPEVADLELAARYWPATQGVRVGGDWYDAFRTGDGSISLVVGDVAGHDRDAAVVMAQVRNLLRGIAYAVGDSPAVVLTKLDEALAELNVDALTTAVLASITRSVADDGSTQHRVRWSNAGHPPPLLISPDGQPELLTQTNDLLLGLQPDVQRREHTLLLAPGAKLLLYTDGLVERRQENLDVGLERLCSAAGRLATLDLDTLCAALMDELSGGAEDDVALLAVRSAP